MSTSTTGIAMPPLTPENLTSALQVFSGLSLQPPTSALIKQAESALLHWENSTPDEYALALLSIVYDQTEASAALENRLPVQAAPVIVPRLGATLALKAAVGRKWKDRGRGGARLRPLPRQANGFGSATPVNTTYLTESTKQAVRYGMLQVIYGGVPDALLVVDVAALPANIEAVPRISPLLAEWYKSANQVGASVQTAAASLIAKVGRLDLPMEFRDLIPTLVGGAVSSSSSSDHGRRMHCLQALDAVLAEICDKRLLLDKKYVGAVVTDHLPALCQVGYKETGGKHSTLHMSVLRRLLRHSLPAAQTSPASNAAADSTVRMVLDAIPGLLTSFREGAKFGSGIGRPVEEEHVATFLEEMCGLVIDTQMSFPIEFGRYLGQTLDLFYQYLVQISSEDLVLEEDSPLERFVMSSMTFLSNVLSCSKYEPDVTNAALDIIQDGHAVMSSDGTKRIITSSGDAFATSSSLTSIEHAVSAVWGYFTPDKMEKLADLAIRRYMVLTRARLEEWRDDPEGFFHAEAGRTSEDDVNTCAQALYLSLVESKAGRNVVAPRIVTMLQDFDQQVAAARAEVAGSEGPALALDAVLLWDSLYTAAGISLGVLEDAAGFDFATFFDGYLLPCLEMILSEQKQTACLPVLRMRIVWLIASNTFSVPAASRSKLYQAILTIIVDEACPQNDTMVKLTAAQLLNNSLFDRDESLAIFKEHSDSIISALYRLAGSCQEYDSRSLVLSCVAFVLTYLMGCGTMNESTANAAVGPIAQIWENAIDENALLKRDVLSIVACIAQAVGPEQSSRLHPIALPMIDAALDPGLREENMFLAEDALGLWLSLVRLSPAYSEDLGSLFRRAYDLLEQDLEHAKILMMIAECYILLGGPAFLNVHSGTLQSIVVQVVGHVRPRGAAYTSLVLEALMRTYPVEGGQLLLQAGVLTTMLNSCAAVFYEQDGSEPDRVIVLYLTTIARSLLAAPRLLDGILPVTSPESTFGPNHLMHLFLKLFNYEGSEAHDLLRRRVWALTLLSLLQPTESMYGHQLLKDLDQLMEVCLQTLKQERMDRSNLVPYEVGYGDDEETFERGQENYDSMLRSHNEKDNAVASDFRQVFKAKMEGLSAALGASYQEAISTVEPVVLKQIEDLLLK